MTINEYMQIIAICTFLRIPAYAISLPLVLMYHQHLSSTADVSTSFITMSEVVVFILISKLVISFTGHSYEFE